MPPPGIPLPSVDTTKHAGEEGPSGIIEPPLMGSAFELDEAVYKGIVLYIVLVDSSSILQHLLAMASLLYLLTDMGCHTGLILPR